MVGDAPAAAVPDTAETRPVALSLRRWALVAAPVLAGVFAIVGSVADPAVGEEGRTLWTAYAENPDPLQWKSFGFHWSYAFWAIAAFMLAGAVRGRGVWLANVAGVLAFLGATTLPGLLVVDFYDSAIGQVAGVDTTVQVNELMEGMWGIKAIVLPGMIGFLLCLPVAALAAWRARLVPAWGAAAAVAGVPIFILSGVSVPGTIGLTAAFTVFAYALARGLAAEPPDA
jgi:hypothetical protein